MCTSPISKLQTPIQEYILFLYLLQRQEKGESEGVERRPYDVIVRFREYNSKLLPRILQSFRYHLTEFRNGLLLAYTNNKQSTLSNL